VASGYYTTLGGRRGRDLGIRVELDLAECAFGTTRELTMDTVVACPSCSGNPTGPQTYPRPCETCGGHGEVGQLIPSVIGQVAAATGCSDCDGYGRVMVSPCRDCNGGGCARARRTIRVRIPAGVQDSTQIQLPGEGETGFSGGPPGDLFLEIMQRPHPLFERCGDDLHCTVFVPMVAAALGTTLSVDSLDGPAALNIRPGTQSGQVIPLHGYGVRHLNRKGRGDLIVHVMVETPASLDAEQRRILSKLAMLRGEEAPVGPFAPVRPGRRGGSRGTAGGAARAWAARHGTGRSATSGRARESRGGRSRS
jgi:molecular chaperone DnaJ